METEGYSAHPHCCFDGRRLQPGQCKSVRSSSTAETSGAPNQSVWTATEMLPPPHPPTVGSMNTHCLVWSLCIIMLSLRPMFTAHFNMFFA